MPDIHAIEETLRRAPDDWQSWLVYADWLTERGDVRGEMLAIEHRIEVLKRGKPPAPERLPEIERLDERRQRLIDTHEMSWFGSSYGHFLFEGRTCFPHRIILSGAGASSQLADLLEQPAAHLLTAVALHDLPHDELGQLAALLPGSRIRWLGIGRSSLDAGAIGRLARSGALRSLEALNLGSPEDFELSWSTWNASMRRNRIGVRGLADLLAGDLSRLVALGLGGNGIGDEGVDLLARAAPPALRALDLRDNGVGTASAATLARAERLGGLRRLGLRVNFVGPEGASTLARSETLRLTDLDLGDDDLDPAAVAEIARSEALAGLTRLVLRDNPLGDEGAAILAASTTLRHLTALDLRGTGCGDAGVAALAASEVLDRVTSLDLGYNPVGDAGAAALARSGHLGALATLDLSHARVGDEGVRAFDPPEALPALAMLRLANNRTSLEGQLALGRTVRRRRIDADGFAWSDEEG